MHQGSHVALHPCTGHEDRHLGVGAFHPSSLQPGPREWASHRRRVFHGRDGLPSVLWQRERKGALPSPPTPPQQGPPSLMSSPHGPVMGSHLCGKRSCSFLSEDTGSGGWAGKHRHEGLLASGASGMDTWTRWAGEQVRGDPGEWLLQSLAVHIVAGPVPLVCSSRCGWRPCVQVPQRQGGQWPMSMAGAGRQCRAAGAPGV